MTTHRCPVCKEIGTLRRSKARPWEQPLGWFRIHPIRCKACSRRFHRRWSLSGKPLEHNASAAGPAPSALAREHFPGVRLNFEKAAVSSARDGRSRKKKPLWQRLRFSPAVQYSLISFAALLLLHYVVGALEFAPLGKAAMWVNVLSLLALVGALLVFIDLCRAQSAPGKAVGLAAVLVLRWECFFLAAEFLYGFVLGPGEGGMASDLALLRQQSPFIWMTYLVLPVSGLMGCLAFLFFGPRSRRSSEPGIAADVPQRTLAGSTHMGSREMKT